MNNHVGRQAMDPEGDLTLPPSMLRDGMLLREQNSPSVYVIYGGAKFGIPSEAVFAALGYSWSDVRVVHDGALTAVPAVPRDGTVLKELNNPVVYLVLGGQRCGVPTEQGLSEWGHSLAEVKVVPDGGLSVLPDGGILAPPPPPPLQPGELTDGRLLREQNSPSVYVIYGGAKFGIPSEAVFAALGYSWEAIRIVPDNTFAAIPNVPRDGTVLKELNNPVVYLVLGGQRCGVPTEQGLSEWGHSLAEVKVVPDGTLAVMPDGGILGPPTPLPPPEMDDEEVQDWEWNESWDQDWDEDWDEGEISRPNRLARLDPGGAKLQKAGPKIHHPFIINEEGGQELKGYVPSPKESTSGVTIATGVDLGQRSAAEIDQLNISESLKNKLKPYAGKKKQEARDYLNKNPLTLTKNQANALDHAVWQPIERQLISAYNAAATKGRSFVNLPWEAQTVMASVAIQYGPNL